MAKVISIGEPANDSERLAIAHLRDHLPDIYVILHNFEIVRNGEFFEVDIAVIAPHAVYVVDVKGVRGLIDVYGNKWYPQGRQPYTSPLLKLHSHARSLKGLIVASQPGRRELEDIYVDAAVFLTASDAVLQDPGGKDAPNVTTLRKSAAFFQNSGRVPGRYSKNIGAMQSMVLKAIQGVARPRSGPMRFGNWEVAERLGATDQYVEYRAFNAFAGARAGTVLLRAYRADPYLPEAEREAQRIRIGHAYSALSRLPAHPGIVGARDFFATEAEDQYILVTEDVPGQALRLYIGKPHMALTLGQKIRVAGDLLQALAHAHGHGVVHRNLTPSTILVGGDGQVRVIGFDFARVEADRSRTISDQIVDELEQAYQAPELYGEPSAASPNSDVFSVGLVLYELFTGERPFARPTEVFDRGAVFAVRPSQLRAELPAALDEWLQRLCTFEPADRPTAAQAAAELASAMHPGVPAPGAARRENPVAPEPEPVVRTVDYSQLPSGTALNQQYVVEKRLGKPGAFGVAYKVIDTFGDVSRAVKLILRDRHSTLERLKKEYRTLLRTPEHPHVVKVIHADVLNGGGPPFIVFEYVDGLDVGEMIDAGLFAVEDAVDLARQVTDGLAHLHRHDVYHCDIKPRNLLWTDQGVKIIDFNVSIAAALGKGNGGGSRRYLPPDLDLSVVPQATSLADRDLYALGLSLYEAVTGRYPWDTQVPPVDAPPPDPREMSGLADLSPDLVEIMLKVIAPRRADRYASAEELLAALRDVTRARRVAPMPVETTSSWSLAGLPAPGQARPNTNPYVDHLLTLYSQSQRSNAGTRGLDAIGKQTYVETALDRDLVPAVLAGEFRLVIISGNAGDGKTAFLQKLESRADAEGASFDRNVVNGCRFELQGRTFVSNYDGSQDEGIRSSDEVLRQFFAPYAGKDTDAWPGGEVRLIAINEGRLVDFLASEEQRLPFLAKIVSHGLVTGAPEHGVAVVNLNLRSVVVDPPDHDGSILDRLVKRMTHPKFWESCLGCDLKDRCYALHNARTFQDATAGPKVAERLKALYTLTHLRGRLHITLRDLRSSLAYMLVGTRDCDQIHELYRNGDRAEVAQAFYFNSWMGGTGSADRLLSLLREVDVGQATDPRLDRGLDFVSPVEDRGLFRFAERSEYDRLLLRRLFEDLPRDVSSTPGRLRNQAHSDYVAMARRRAFFERRDAGWQQMLPYHAGQRMLGLVRGDLSTADVLAELLHAVNRGEGLGDPERLGTGLALQVREVDGGTIRSYRVYPRERFTLAVDDTAARARFVEHMPSGLVLRYHGNGGNDAELLINLDVFEMLHRLNEGYRPSVEEEQGYYLSLAVFKNLLGSAPYQEVLLTTTGQDFFRILRQQDGRLVMERAGTGAT